MNEKIKMIKHDINWVRNKMQEINRICNKLEDNRLTLEEKLILTVLKKEKVEELPKICKLHLEKSESEYKPEHKPLTGEDEIEWQKR